jgi:hypothetical protein
VLFGWALQMYVGVRFFFFQCPLRNKKTVQASQQQEGGGGGLFL